MKVCLNVLIDSVQEQVNSDVRWMNKVTLSFR